MAETRAYHYPAEIHSELKDDWAEPVPSERHIMPADIPDPIAAKPVVVGLYHPSGVILYAGAVTATEAANALVETYRLIKPELPAPALTTTTTTTVPKA
jgi:hypothetical protein